MSFSTLNIWHPNSWMGFNMHFNFVFSKFIYGIEIVLLSHSILFLGNGWSWVYFCGNEIEWSWIFGLPHNWFDHASFVSFVAWNILASMQASPLRDQLWKICLKKYGTHSGKLVPKTMENINLKRQKRNLESLQFGKNWK